MALQQIANFHNSLTDNLLTCHKPCLLEAARAFEAIALHPVDTHGNTLTWASGVALDSYLSKLQARFCNRFIVHIYAWCIDAPRFMNFLSASHAAVNNASYKLTIMG